MFGYQKIIKKNIKNNNFLISNFNIKDKNKNKI